MLDKAHIEQAEGDWLNKFRWDWYGNLTFNKLVTKEEAIKRFTSWKVQLTKATGNPIQFIIVIEHSGSALHLNFLLSGAKNENPHKWQQKWYFTNGEAKILRYHPGQGAMHYISRKLARKDAEVIFSKGFESTQYKKPHVLPAEDTHSKHPQQDESHR